MGYNCVVLIKQVPDTKRITGDVMNDDGTVKRSALPAIFNPEDLNALELALQIKEQFGGHITVITMGLPAASEVLRDSLFRGADDAILITDPRCAASDTLATSYILSCAVKRIDYDIVLCGRQAIDGDTAQVGPQLAEKLGITQITYVEQLIELDGKTITAQRNIGNGWQQVKAEMPVLLTVIGAANEPRVAAAKKMMKYKNARTPIEVEQEAGIQKTCLAPIPVVGVRSQKSEVSEQRTEVRSQRTENRSQKSEDRKQKSEVSEAKIKRLIEKKCSELSEKGLLIKQWDLDFLEADLSWCGQNGSPTKVHRIQSVVLAAKESKSVEPNNEGISDMIHELIEEKTIA